MFLRNYLVVSQINVQYDIVKVVVPFFFNLDIFYFGASKPDDSWVPPIHRIEGSQTSVRELERIC
jgi:hypothetical protein